MMRYDPDYFAEILAFDSGIYKLESRGKKRMGMGQKKRQTVTSTGQSVVNDGPEQRTYKGKSRRPPKYWIET